MIKSNAKQFLRRMNDTKKQMRFATSKAINDTLGDARKSVISQASAAQKGNKKWWLNKKWGIWRKFAKKTKLKGSLYTKMWWAKLQEKGGTKHKKAHKMPVPTSAVAKSNRKSGGISKVMKQKTVFRNKDKIYRRVGGKKSRKVKLLFTLKDHVNISKPMLKFREVAHKVTKRRFKKHLKKSTEYAFKTRK